MEYSGSSPPQPIRRKLKLRVLANKTDENENLDEVYSLYKLGFGDPLFVSSLQGSGMHEIFREINSIFTKESIEALKLKKKLRRERFDKLKEDLVEEITTSLKAKNREYDVAAWIKDFDLANGNPENNSDLDEDSGLDPKKYMSTSIVMEKTGISYDTFMSKRRIKISIVGRPNVGKSSLVNAILKRNRVIVNDQPHTTTDPVGVSFTSNGVKFFLSDTGGLQSHSHQKTDLERLIYNKTIRTINMSDVVIVVIDALDAMRNTDLVLAEMGVEEGRAIVMVVNKWDLVDPNWKERAAKYIMNQVDNLVSVLTANSVQFVSAKDGTRVDNILKQVHKTYLAWNTRISTGMLNIWLRKFKKVQKLPTTRAHKLKIFFITQIKTRPPTFSVFINDIEMADEAYTRFMRWHLAEEFNIHGTPIRLVFRGTKYKSLKKKYERVHNATRGQLKRMFLQRRRMKTFAKIKLDEIGSKSNRTKQDKK